MASADSRSRSTSLRWQGLGLALVLFGLFGLASSITQADLLWNSALVVTGSVGFGAVLGGFAGWLIGWTDVPFRRLWLTLLLTWAMTPLVVQLAGWDALWGRLSWLAALNQVTYAAWFKGLAAVIWVQAFACVPWIALLVVAARHSVSTSPEEESQLQLHLWQVFQRVSVRRHAALFSLIAVVVGLRSFEQIEVSDVYQIRTWPEVWYLGFALGKFEGLGTDGGAGNFFQFLFGSDLATNGWGTISATNGTDAAVVRIWEVAASLLALVSGLGLIIVHGVWAWFQVLPNWDWQPARRLAIYRRVRWCFFLFLVVAVPQLVIWSNLVIRCGLRVAQTGDDAVRGWSWQVMAQRLQTAAIDYQEPIIWSWLIGLVAGVSVACIGICTAWASFRCASARLIAVLVAAISLMIPSPLVSLLWYRILHHSPFPWLDEMAQTSILGPVLAVGFKHLGIALLYGLVLFQQQPAAWREEMQLNRQGTWSQFWHLGFRVPLLFHLLLVGVLTMSGAGDLSASFATLPPGLDTLPRRLLGDLHSGAGGNVAAACLLQISSILLASLLVNFCCCKARPN